MVARAEHQPDAFVAERRQVVVRLLDGVYVVDRYPGEPDVIDGRVDEYGRQAALLEPAIVLVLGVGLRIESAGEQHAGDVLVEQHVDVVALAHPIGRPRAKHRGESALGEVARRHLGERREDRVLQLRQDQTDQPRSVAAQLGRPVVAEDIQRGEHRRAGRVGDAGLAVEHATDRRLADADVARYVGESPCHVRKPNAFRCKPLHPLALLRNCGWTDEVGKRHG